jgi:hypothetical protein
LKTSRRFFPDETEIFLFVSIADVFHGDGTGAEGRRGVGES